MKTKRLSLILTAALLSALLLFSSCSKTETGICGEDTFWTLGKDGVLTVSGTGPISTPIEPKNDVLHLVVEDGITEIGDNAFDGLNLLSTAELPDSLKVIGSEAFRGCCSLSELRIPDSVEDVDGSAFEDWDEAQQIISQWYEGNADEWNQWFLFWKDKSDGLRAYVEDKDFCTKITETAQGWIDYFKEHGPEMFELFRNFDKDNLMASLYTLATQIPRDLLADLEKIYPMIEEKAAEIRDESEGAEDEISDNAEGETQTWWEFWSNLDKDITDKILEGYSD